MISKGPSGLGTGLEGGAHPPHQHEVKLRLSCPAWGLRRRSPDPAATTNRCFRSGQQGAGGQAGRGPGAHHSSLERLFGQLWRQTCGDREVGRGQREEQAEAGKGCPQPVLLPASSCRAPQSSAREGSEDVRGWNRSLDAVTVPALEPVLRAAPGPQPFRDTKEGGASSLARQPHRGDRHGQAEGGKTRHQGPRGPGSKPRRQSGPAARPL